MDPTRAHDAYAVSVWLVETWGNYSRERPRDTLLSSQERSTVVSGCQATPLLGAATILIVALEQRLGRRELVLAALDAARARPALARESASCV